MHWPQLRKLDCDFKNSKYKIHEEVRHPRAEKPTFLDMPKIESQNLLLAPGTLTSPLQSKSEAVSMQGEKAHMKSGL